MTRKDQGKLQVYMLSVSYRLIHIYLCSLCHYVILEGGKASLKCVLFNTDYITLGNEAVWLYDMANTSSRSLWSLCILYFGCRSGRVGGVDLVVGMVGVLYNLMWLPAFDEDITMNAILLQRNSFRYPVSVTGYQIEVEIKFWS